MRRLLGVVLVGVTTTLAAAAALATGSGDGDKPSHPARPFARENLVAWCIVPFDSKHRTPAQRAEMLQRIGIRHYAYDWRDEHLPTFDAELDELAKHGIELTAVWFPDTLNPQARVLLDGLRRHKLKPQLWVMSNVENVPAGVDRIAPVAREAQTLGCTVALYNHGGWFGEPENQLAIIEQLNLLRPIYSKTTNYGHFGKIDDPDITWEATDKAAELKKAAK